jgi:hypothetical protein
MPFADYKDFADCVAKNKDKDTPDAYCGYIKNQVEGGKKKEEVCMECAEHEQYHLEEGIKKMEEETKFGSANSVMNLALKSEDEKILEEEIAKLEEELKPKSATSVMNLALKHDYPEDKVEIHYSQKAKEPEDETLKEASAFVTTLKATVDEITLMAKDQGWASTSGVSDKVEPTEPTYKLEVTGEDVDVAVKQAKGGGTVVQVNWFNTVMAELKDIVSDANTFFEDAGWNSREVVKEYNEHKKHWGKDYTAGT